MCVDRKSGQPFELLSPQNRGVRGRRRELRDSKPIPALFVDPKSYQDNFENQEPELCTLSRFDTSTTRAMTETSQKLSALILIADGSEEIEFVTPYEYVPHPPNWSKSN